MEFPKFTANCAKSAQFAHCRRKSRKIRTICVNFPRFSVPTSKIAKISGNSCFGKLRKFRRPFSDSHHRKRNSQNLQQIAQNLLNLPTVTANHAKFAQFASISQLQKFTANSAKSAQFAHCHRKSCKIRVICINFPRFSLSMGRIVKFRDIHVPL